MPVISALLFFTTDSTIVATWTTDVSADSNLTAGGKAAIDNGVAASSTSHQCIVTGLLPSTLYSCVVTSGGTSSSPQNVTTNAAPTRLTVKTATMGAISTVANAPRGDTYRTFESNDGNVYITQDDGFGFVAGSPNAGYNTQLGVLTNESVFAGTLKSLSAYGAFSTTNGTDGPGGIALTNKSTGLIGLNGNLHMFVYRQDTDGTSNRYCNWIKSTDHGATWNNFTASSTFLANGNPVTPNSPAEPIQFFDLTIGLVNPVIYGADDGTLGYNSVGNQIDGGNAYVYCTFNKDNTPIFLLRIPRIKFDAQTTSAFEYWVGPGSPAVADFVNDTNWSASPTSATVINSGVTAGPGGAWPFTIFVPTLNSYLMFTSGTGSPGTIFKFYAAPTPAGPWTVFYAQSNPTVNSQWYGPFPMHRDLIGNTATNNIPVRIIFQGESSGANYKPNWSTLTLSTTMPPTNTFIQGTHDAAGQSGPALTLAFPGNVTAGNLLVVAWRRSTTGVVNNVTDNMGVGNVWTVAYDTGTAGAFGGWAWVVTKGTGACTPSVNCSAGQSGNGLLAIGEWNGPNSLRGAPAANVQSATQTPVSASVSAVAGDLIVASTMSVNGGGTSIAAGSGYVLREVGIPAQPFTTIEDALNTPGGATTAGFTYTGSAQTGEITGIGAFFFTPPATAPGNKIIGLGAIDNRWCTKVLP